MNQSPTIPNPIFVVRETAEVAGAALTQSAREEAGALFIKNRSSLAEQAKQNQSDTFGQTFATAFLDASVKAAKETRETKQMGRSIS